MKYLGWLQSVGLFNIYLSPALKMTSTRRLWQICAFLSISTEKAALGCGIHF